jgi:translation initiation factor 2 alpha subunit (eIF-2alpha)
MVQLYKNRFPAINDIVFARVIEINELNIVINLIDYNNLTGYISFSELCRKRKFNIHKIVNVGKDVIAQITGFNNEKNFCELSIRSLVPSDIENFNKNHHSYLKLYNLWRYIYMKMTPDINMDTEKINSENLNIFMEKTFWNILTCLEEKNETENNENNDDEKIINNDEIFNILINSKTNMDLLNYILDYDKNIIKTILDNYSLNKIVPIKQSKTEEIKVYSYDCDGLENIKKALDYTTFAKWNDLQNNYEISILYLTGSKYSLNIKQKKPLEENIMDIYNYLIEELNINCKKYNVYFST